MPAFGAGYGPVSSAIFRVARTHRMLAGALLAELGLYPGQELTLMLLAECGPLPQREIACRLGTHASTVTKMLQRLERGGFVSRTPSASDGRVVVVALTPRGEGLIDRLHDVWRRLEELTVAELSPTQRKNLLPAMAKLEQATTAALADLCPPEHPS